MNGSRRAFTLIELMLVMAIMGLLGTVSVGGYRAMRRGMEERGTMQNVNQFIRYTYQRALIDRQPTAIYFWNETRRNESDDTSILVVGRAVAVRRAGRISNIQSGYLIDEFGDLAAYKGTDFEGEEDDGTESKQGIKAYLYKMSESGFRRSRIGQATAAVPQNLTKMMSDGNWRTGHGADDPEVEAYGYYLDNTDGITWKVGDAYGFEFAELTLPNNYIFESSFSQNISSPITKIDNVLRFSPESSPSGERIAVSVIRMSKGGKMEAKDVGRTVDPSKPLSQQDV